MNGLTIRTRLTLMIVVLTGVISAIGVLFGIGVLESQVRDAAIDERADQFQQFFDFELAEFAESGEVVLDENAVADFGDFQILLGDEGELLTADAEFAEEIADEIAEQRDETALFVGSYASRIPNFDEIASRIGNENGELIFWLGPGEIFAATATDIRFITIEEVGDTAVIPANDLFELGVVPLEFGDFDFPFGVEEVEEPNVEAGIREVAGQQFGFLAEVSDELDALAAIRDVLRVVVVSLAVLAGLATWFIAGRALRPVGAITAQVREISSGTLAERVPEPGSNDEVGVLARTMNSMLSRLETSDLRRRQFVSDASHELRTPVAVLRSEAEVARRAPDSTTMDEFAGVVLGESKRLEGLVEDLLSLARGDESRRLSATNTIDVDEIVLAEAERTRSFPVDKKAVSAGRVVGHEDDMQRSMSHLLDNAARHARSAIAVGVQTRGDRVHVWVDDDGEGVSSDQRERVFERFVRLDDARNRDAGGAGLGLAVALETIERMNGTITIEDSPLGGARFSIDLPAG